MNNKVSAIIVTYNRLSKLKTDVHCLLNQSYKLENIYIINNNSKDGTKNYLKYISKSYSCIHPITLKKNIGGAGGFSVGTKEAFNNSNSNYFWLMDDDSIPTKNSLITLLRAAKSLHNRFGFLCSNIRWSHNNAPCLANIPQVSDDWTDLINIGLVKLKSATFVSLLLKRSVIAKLGLPISDMFIWGDDTEYTTRISKQFRSYLVSNSIVLHNSARNVNNASIFNVPINRACYYKYSFRNLLFISKKYSNYRKTIELLLSDIFVLIRILFNSKDHRFLRFRYIFTGILDGLFFAPKVKFPR